MTLDQQIQDLIDQAPQDDLTPQIMVAIAPVLKAIASQLQHLNYYIPQNLRNQWVVTTLQKRSQPEVQKRVLYAYSTIQDARASLRPDEIDSTIAQSIPVTHILFQMTALESVDSIIFQERPGQLETSVEIFRNDLQTLLQESWLQWQQAQSNSDIA